jgi:hypothetical protein
VQQSAPVAEQTTPAAQPPAPVAEQKPDTDQITKVAVSAPETHNRQETAPAHAVRKPVVKPPAAEPVAVPAATSSYPPVSYPAIQQTPQQPAGPSQQELDKATDTLAKLQARADAVRSSLQRLREAQAAGGLELRQDIAAAASRLDIHMHAAELALQSSRLDAAKNNMAHADQDLTTLEAFFGR